MNDEWREPPADPPQPSPAPVNDGPGARQIAFSAVTLAIMFVVGIVYARDAVTSALLFIAILLGLVMAHEAAHFITAKAFGIYVHEFALGFPPRIWAKRIGDTEYSINWLPIGGFVRLEGEEGGDGPRSFSVRPSWQRLIVLASGAVVNLILPVVLFAAALMIPHTVQEGRATISEVIPNTPAATAGLRTNDVILAVGGRDAENLSDASRLVRLNQGKTVDFTVRRDGQVMDISVYARWGPPAGQGPTGISIAPEVVAPDGRPFTVTESLAPWHAVPQGAQMTWETMILARNEVIGWFKGAGGPQLAGPVGIAQATGEVARSSETTAGAISPLLELAALLSINLGILNLLPLPMLDGGRVLFLLIEVVRGGKRIAPEREALVHLVGFVAFMALAIVITFSDIGHIINGTAIFR